MRHKQEKYGKKGVAGESQSVGGQPAQAKRRQNSVGNLNCDYREFELAMEYQLRLFDLYTKWDNVSMISQTILVAAVSQLLVHSQTISRTLPQVDLQKGIVYLAVIGLVICFVWLLTNLRNFYYVTVRQQILKDLECFMTKNGCYYGFYNRELEGVNRLTDKNWSTRLNEHKKYCGSFCARLASLCSPVFGRRFSTQHRMFVIPLIFIVLWIGLLVVFGRVP